MNNQPHRVDFHRPTRPVEGCTINVHPEQAPDPAIMPLDKARDILLHPGGVAQSLVALAAAVIVTEYDRRGAAEQRLNRQKVFYQKEGVDLMKRVQAIESAVDEATGLDITDLHIDDAVKAIQGLREAT